MTRIKITSKKDATTNTIEVAPGKAAVVPADQTARILANKDDIREMRKDGDDLVVILADGSQVRVTGYFDCPDEERDDLTIEDGEGRIWVVDLDAEACAVAQGPLAWTFEPWGEALAAGDVPAVASVTSTYAAEAQDDDGLGAAPLIGLGVLGLGGIAAVAGGGGGSGDEGGSGGDGGGDGNGDTTAPDAPVLDPTTGTIISGTAESGSSISIDFDGDGQGDASVTTDDDGNFSFTPDTPIEDGTEISVTATDDAGNESDPATVVVDASTPTPSIDSIRDDLAPVTGIIADGGSTNDLTPTIDGSGAEAGATIEIRVGTDVIGTTTADANGDWTFQVAEALDEGTYSFTASATDALGNTSAASDPYTVIIDATAPDAPLLDASDGTTVTGTAEPGSDVMIDLDDDGTVDATVSAGTDGSFSYTPDTPLDDDTVVTATATDEAGNTSDEGSVTVDTGDGGGGGGGGGGDDPPASPVITDVTDDVVASTGTVADGETTNDARPTISGTAVAGASVTVRDNGNPLGTTTADGSGAWTFTPSGPLADGSHAFTATATTAAGTSAASDPYTVIIDATAPDAPLLDASDGTTVTGTAEPGSDVMIDLDDDGTVDATVSAGTDGSFSYTPDTPLDDDTVVTATATDEAGNTSDEGSVTVDTGDGGGGGGSGPVADIEITAIDEDTPPVGDFETEDLSPTVSGTLSEVLAGDERVEVRIDGGMWAIAQVSGTGWSYDLGVQDEATHIVEARVINDENEVGDVDSQQIVIIDTDHAPIVQASDADLLGLISAETLGLIDFNGQALFAFDPDNDLTSVTVAFEPLLSVDLFAYTLRADETLAASLGLSVDVDNDPGLLGIVAPSSVLTITAIDGGTMDNLDVNALLATVRYEQDITLVGAEVLNATTISATDETGLSDSATVGTLVDVTLLNGTAPAAALSAGTLFVDGKTEAETAVSEEWFVPNSLLIDLGWSQSTIA